MWMRFRCDFLFCCEIVYLTGGDVCVQVVKYTIAVTLGSVLEGVSGQNDNVVLPVYVWSVLALMDV